MKTVLTFIRTVDVRSTGLEPVPVAGHAPQTCAYADSATTANKHRNYKATIKLCQDKGKNLRQFKERSKISGERNGENDLEN